MPSYRHDTPISNLYRTTGNPWMKAKEVARRLPEATFEQVRTSLSKYLAKGAMESRYQRPRTEYRFVEGALEAESQYIQKYQERHGRTLAPYLEVLEASGHSKAAQHLRDTFTGGV